MDVETLTPLVDLGLPEDIQRQVHEFCARFRIEGNDQRTVREDIAMRYHFAGQCVVVVLTDEGRLVRNAGDVFDPRAIDTARDWCDELIETFGGGACRIEFPMPLEQDVVVG